MQRFFFTLLFTILIYGSLHTQTLPAEYQYAADSTLLLRGKASSQGLYDPTRVDTMRLIFPQSDYWNLLLKNHDSSTDLPGSLIYKGKTYDSTGVRFKGMTSYMMVQGKKKSFNITLDYAKKQDIDGYTTFNLHNCAEDPSMMREFLYSALERNHNPGAKTNYVVLIINGKSFGLYLNVQQLDKHHAKEWFGDSKATRWRAESQNSMGGFGGGGFFPGMGSDSTGMPGMPFPFMAPDSMQMGGMGNPFMNMIPDSVRTKIQEMIEKGGFPPFGGMPPDSMRTGQAGMFPPFGGGGGMGSMMPPFGMPGPWGGDQDSMQMTPGDFAGGFPGGFPGGGDFDFGAGFGAGKSSLNYLGEDSLTYQENYTLKRAYKDQPWQDLINACKALSDTTAPDYLEKLNNYLDVDATLWYLATEILFTDDDGYVSKGGMDYSVYYDPVTARIIPVEMDGNSSLSLREAVQWGPFYKSNNKNYPLLNILLNIPECRQRYLAHVRTLLHESFDTLKTDALIHQTSELIKPYVLADSIKLFSNKQFLQELQNLKKFFRIRQSYLQSNTEVQEAGVEISDVKLSESKNGISRITAMMSDKISVNSVYLYYEEGTKGRFKKIEMYDDGKHNDGRKNDGVYGAAFSVSPNSTIIRYYIESIAGNPSKTRCYAPAGAEHDLFVIKKTASK